MAKIAFILLLLSATGSLGPIAILIEKKVLGNLEYQNQNIGLAISSKAFKPRILQTFISLVPVYVYWKTMSPSFERAWSNPNLLLKKSKESKNETDFVGFNPYKLMHSSFCVGQQSS